MSQCSGNAIDHEVELHYYTGIRNFGDELSPYLISKITGRKVSLASSEEGLYAIGSILTHKALWSSCVVWGTGTLCHDSLSGETLRVFPLRKLFKNPCSQAELNKIVPFGFSLQRQKMVFFLPSK